MLVVINGLLEDMEDYVGKNGWGSKLVVSYLKDKKRKFLKLLCKNRAVYDYLVEHDKLQEEIILEVELEQSDFGLKFLDVVSVS